MTQSKVPDSSRPQFRYTFIYVNSIPDIVRFYQEAFGFELKFAPPSGLYVELDTGSTVLALVSDTMRPESYDQAPAGLALGFVVQDVEQAFQGAIEAGALPVEQPTLKPWGQTTALVKDPNGTLIELGDPARYPA